MGEALEKDSNQGKKSINQFSNICNNLENLIAICYTGWTVFGNVDRKKKSKAIVKSEKY